MQPKEVPLLTPLTNEEQKQYEGAARRREIRLIQSGRMKPSEAKEVKSFFEIEG